MRITKVLLDGYSKRTHKAPPTFVIVDISNVLDYFNTVKTSVSFDDCVSPWIDATYEWDTRRYGGHLEVCVSMSTRPREKELGGWHYEGDVFVRERGEIFHDLIYAGDIEETGKATSFKAKKGPDYQEVMWVRDMSNNIEYDTIKDIDKIAMGFLSPVFVAISFANCHNVKVVEHHPTITRQMKRHGGEPVIYKTLDIPGLAETIRYEHDYATASPHIKRRMHLCRGHRAHYENLFGRLGPRTVWVPSHIKGAHTEGVVAKDYRISHPL